MVVFPKGSKELSVFSEDPCGLAALSLSASLKGYQFIPTLGNES